MYKRRGKLFAVRTIRNGKVKIGGQWFYPDEQWLEYDGRLDSMRYAFGRYWRRTIDGWRVEPFIYCWGPEQNYRTQNNSQWIEDPQVIDGTLPWTWWRIK